MFKKLALIFSCLLTLGACSTTAASGIFGSSQFVTDINLIATGIVPVANEIKNLANVTPATRAEIQALLVEIQANKTQIDNSATLIVAGTPAKALVTALNLFLQIAATLPLPAPYVTIAQAASVLAPIIEGQLGLLGAIASNATTTMTPDAARLILQQAAGMPN